MAAFVLTGRHTDPDYGDPGTVYVLCEGSRRACEAERARRMKFGWIIVDLRRKSEQ